MKREEIINILFFIIFILVIFGFFIFLITHPIGEGSVEILHVNIIYQDHQENYHGELAQCAGETIEGTVLAVKFYNLNSSKTYSIYDGRNQSKLITEFTGKEEFIFWINVNKGDCFFLKSNNRDLIWICVAKTSRQTED